MKNSRVFLIDLEALSCIELNVLAWRLVEKTQHNLLKKEHQHRALLLQMETHCEGPPLWAVVLERSQPSFCLTMLSMVFFASDQYAAKGRYQMVGADLWLIDWKWHT